MANTIVCAELTGAIDLSCVRNIPKGYFQEAVIINFNDIDRTASVPGNLDGATCDYTIQMILTSLKKGIQVKLPENGSTIKGSYDKSTNDQGFVEYLHKVQIMVVGASSETKCKLDKLDHGRYVIALQLRDGTVEVYGWENGLTTGDYTYDIVEGGGGAIIPLQSKDNEKESMIPLVYKPQTGGDPNADFNEQFEAA
ncbi:hypothetical protein [Chryseobacterium potabilaquae]|uniref:Uncharacterized protein n=1 Tax=Chryseobacterium potabilaquae TaxID=2675057 RepID=A0A6N4X3E0_9FLAO|nr:hypothetical protein [Chryseobacterium potabilaquae]CAA7195452.1 hypothetical protein CHRY9293_01649 [Chryseobacterium potabilaquae]